ncbi:MAG: serine/threonine protein kinase, partial [Cyanobacteria bacterium SZAS LIN-2]|nr:serine/threonine protein kinase [Cyanobacteria bacterium SZAS LIN-2]
MATQDDPNNQQDKTRLTIGGTPGAREFQAGDIVGGTYEVRDFIGAGGMGNVYRVRHTIMQTEYALKTLSTDKVTETAWRRFQNEAQAIARMNHPNIVGIYNLGLEQGRLPYYVMDLPKGQTLAELIETNGPLEPIRAIEIFLEVSAGLSYAHKKGIIHRDIKPANVVILETP